jgi:hypothetical protein
MMLPPRNAGIPCEKDEELSFSPSCDVAMSRLERREQQDQQAVAGIVRAVQRTANNRAYLGSKSPAESSTVSDEAEIA